MGLGMGQGGKGEKGGEELAGGCCDWCVCEGVRGAEAVALEVERRGDESRT